MSNIKKAIESIRETGGCSYNLSTGELNPPSGYMVGIKSAGQQEVKYREDSLEDHVKTYLLNWSQVLEGGDLFFGAWVYKGILYFNLSKKYEDRYEAVSAGRKWGQISIWDNEKKEEIFL